MVQPTFTRNGPLISHILITSLEGTLVGLGADGTFEPRPFAEHFLAELHRYFDVVVLSSADEDSAQAMVNRIDPDSKWIQNVILLNSLADSDVLEELRANHFMTDKTVILKSPRDTMLGKTKKEVAVSAWDLGDPRDTTLKDLVPVLKNIVQLKVRDVEGYLNGIREQMIVNINKGSLTPYAHVILSDNTLGEA